MVIVVLGVCFPVQSFCEDDTPSCCRKSLTQETAAKQDCCDTKSESKPFEKACCAMDGNKTSDSKANTEGQQGTKPGQGSQHGVMRDAHTLVFNYQSIQRQVIEISNGVRTRNTTSDPELISLLRKHPKEMDKHLSGGGQVRPWDPLFAELAKHHDSIKMEFRDIDNGIEVISTSDDPEVVKLIRAHAYKVSEFVERGRAAMHEATPLPDDYYR